MVKIMLASHGNLAAGMLSSAEMVFGKQDNVSVICAYVDGEDDVSTRIKGSLIALHRMTAGSFLQIYLVEV